MMLASREEIRDNISNDLAGSPFSLRDGSPPSFLPPSLLPKFHKSTPYPPSPISIIGEIPAAAVVPFSAFMARLRR